MSPQESADSIQNFRIEAGITFKCEDAGTEHNASGFEERLAVRGFQAGTVVVDVWLPQCELCLEWSRSVYLDSRPAIDGKACTAHITK